MRLLWAYDDPVIVPLRHYPYCAIPTAAWLLRKGTLTLRFATTQESYSAGTWIFPRAMAGSQIFSDDAHLLSVRFHLDWLNGRPLFDSTRSLSFPAEEALELTAAGEALIGFFQRRGMQDVPCGGLHASLSQYLGMQPAFGEWIRVYYETMVRRGVEPEPIGMLHESVRQALSYLNHRSLDTPFHERELVPVCHLSLSQINKLFVQQAKTTPAAFWNQRRLAAAQQELVGSQQSIKAVGFSLGFSSPETFSRWFHQQTGYAPRVFRASRQ